MKIYCSHVWVSYIADPKGGKVPYEFCHRCHTTYLPFSGLEKQEIEIGHTLENQ